MSVQRSVHLAKKLPWAVWPLIVFLVLLGFGGLYGGFAMLYDPSGNFIQMAEALPMLHVPSYTLPGLFLLFVMGIAPFVLVYALIARPGWRWLQSLFNWSRHHWAWTGSLLIGLILAVWLIFQGFLIGFLWPIQFMIAGLDVLILVFTLILWGSMAYTLN
jgi:hypothetical protein